MPIRGIVRVWHEEDGWGVIDSASIPGGCRVHYSTIATRGFRGFTAGQEVELEWETPGQDGYDFVARRVWPSGQEPYESQPLTGLSEAYRSSLTIRWDDASTT